MRNSGGSRNLRVLLARRLLLKHFADSGSGRDCKDFKKLLGVLVEADRESEGPACTHLLLETTGLADVGFFTSVFREPPFAKRFRHAPRAASR